MNDMKTYPTVKQKMEKCLDELIQIYGKGITCQAKKVLDVSNLRGATISEHDQLALVEEMQMIFVEAKETALKKYTPVKYRTPEREAVTRERMRKIEQIIPDVYKELVECGWVDNRSEHKIA